jgi:hypothetical protein
MYLLSLTTYAPIIGVAAILRDARFDVVAWLAYCLGAVVIGSLPIGHEYTGGTLPLLLSQPGDRRRLFVMKFGAATLMLLMLGLITGATLFNGPSVNLWFANGAVPRSHRIALLVLPALAALSIAPVFTMRSRSPVAGTVFTLGVLGATWGLGELRAKPHRLRQAESSADLVCFPQRLAVHRLGLGVFPTEPLRPVLTAGALLGPSTSRSGVQVLVIRAQLQKGSGGGPVLDRNGALLGMVIGRDEARPELGVVLPSATIASFLAAHGVSLPPKRTKDAIVPIPEDFLARVSALVQCMPAR